MTHMDCNQGPDGTMDISEDPMWIDDFEDQIVSLSAPGPFGMPEKPLKL